MLSSFRFSITILLLGWLGGEGLHVPGGGGRERCPTILPGMLTSLICVYDNGCIIMIKQNSSYYIG